MKTKPYKEIFNHSYNRRKFSHDYYGRCIYHVILKKNQNSIPFGVIKGNAAIAPGKEGCAYIEKSHLGLAIARGIKTFNDQYSIIQIIQYCIMPDHIHFIVFKKEKNEKHLGNYIGEFKRLVTYHFNQLEGSNIFTDDIFLENYTDKLLFKNRSLVTWFKYIRENPHRLAMRIQHPGFFQRKRKLMIDGKEYEAYGNLFHLRNPDKMTVRVRRKFSSDEIRKHEEESMEAASLNP